MVATITSSYAAVTQVASQKSDKIFALKPAFSVETGFTKELEAASGVYTALQQSNDPFYEISQYAQNNNDSILSVTTSLAPLFQSLPYLNELGKKTVIHVDASQKSDFGLLSSLRHSGFVFLQSFSTKEAQLLSVAAYAVADKLEKPVIHFFGNVGEDAISPASVELELESEGAEEAVVAEALQKVGVAPFEYIGSKSANAAIVLFGAADPFIQAVAQNYSSLGLVLIRAYRPWSTEALVKALPSSVTKLALAEQLLQQTTNWTPLTQDLIINKQENSSSLPELVSFQLGLVTYENVRSVLDSIAANLKADLPLQKLFIGELQPQQTIDAEQLKAQQSAKKLEEAYTSVLGQLFGDRLNTINASDRADAGIKTNPEYGFGAYLAQQDNQKGLVEQVQHALKDNDFTAAAKVELLDLLSQWIVGARDISSIKDQTVFKNTSDRVIELLEQDASSSSKTAKQLLGLKSELYLKSNWLIGSDAWSYDLGNSGVHHVISSGENVNMLLIDSQPYSQVQSGNRKKDVGLYAMNFGNVYVASVAVYASYTQLLQALVEAEKFDGPSVVVAYLPYASEQDDALKVLQETKNAVETGYWPLYRYNPRLQDKDAFKLDSFHIRKNLEAFLDRENKLTMLSNQSPTFARSLKGSYGADVREAQKSKAKQAYSKLLDGLSGPPLTVLFASDGGTAESVAKRLQRRAKGRGLKAIVMAFDDFPIEELSQEENVVFITSTAGQGELPQNGRVLWDALKNSTDVDLASVKYSVFCMGDSLYWPRKEDAIYYNKPGKDLNTRLKVLGGEEMVPLGLGDEQADDGYATAYNDWEPLLWTALGVDGVAGIDEPPPITNEDIKIGSNFLRGTIAEGLQDTSTGAISASDQQVTKFHGIYMQDDRDVRDERKAQGLEPAYAFMVRVRLPGCVATPDQWLRIDELSDERGNGTFKITTRGTFQLHGVIKEDLKPAIRGMNAALIDTVAACGDVDRNVVAAALPENKKVHDELVRVSHSISEHLLPETTAYHEIWLEGDDSGDKEGYTDSFANRTAGPKKKKTLVSGSTLVDHEPLYGPTYLPRKFKISIAAPPYNDVDVYAHDIGLVAIVEENEVVGFNVLIGGGMGTTHNNKKTYPRAGSNLGFVTTDKIEEVCEKIMLVQRDNGDRQNRKHARLKYTVDDMSHDVYREEVEKLLGYKFEAPRDFKFDSNTDKFGWTTDETGLHHFTTFVENGRVEDTPELQFKTGLRKVAHILATAPNGEFRLTANQHILISNITDEILPTIKQVLSEYKLDNVAFSGLRLSSAACVAFPTCGLAMAESERYLPELITKLEGALEEYGLRHDSIVMRMTGCPNGCARPWLAEIALVGKAYGAYNMMLGGGFHGQRLNKLYRQSIKEDEILAILKPLFKRWALERNQGEPFGDFLIRVGVIAETIEGKDFWENVNEDA